MLSWLLEGFGEFGDRPAIVWQGRDSINNEPTLS